MCIICNIYNKKMYIIYNKYNIVKNEYNLSNSYNL